MTDYAAALARFCVIVPLLCAVMALVVLGVAEWAQRRRRL